MLEVTASAIRKSVGSSVTWMTDSGKSGSRADVSRNSSAGSGPTTVIT